MNFPLQSLPNEILLNVASRLVNPFRSVQNDDLVEEGATNYYHDLYNIALTSRRFSEIARESLLSELVVVPFTKLDRLLETYTHYPHFAPRTRSLDVVHGYKTTLNDVNDPFGWPRINSIFKEACIKIIRRLEIDEGHKNDWIASLDYTTREKVETGNDNITGHFPAQDTFFGLLLVTLPNLRRLHLGTLFITDVPVMTDLFCDCQTNVGNSMPSCDAWYSGYLRDAMLLIAPKLTHLEIPLQWYKGESSWHHYRKLSRSTQVLRAFTNLRTLIIPAAALFSPPIKGVPFSLPPTLEHITFVGDRDFLTAQGICRVLDKIQRKDSGLRSIDIFQLRRVYESQRKTTSLAAQRHYLSKILVRTAQNLGILVRVHYSEGNSIGERMTIENYLRSRDGGRKVDLAPLPGTDVPFD